MNPRIMELRDAADICRLIASSPFHVAALRSVRALALPDWWIGAGFVRSIVWDHLHGFAEPTPLDDVDVIWFDAQRAAAGIDRALKTVLAAAHSGLRWSVKNQARMHGRNGDEPYRSSADAMRHWPETATAVAVTLSASGTLALAAPPAPTICSPWWYGRRRISGSIAWPPTASVSASRAGAYAGRGSATHPIRRRTCASGACRPLHRHQARIASRYEHTCAIAG